MSGGLRIRIIYLAAALGTIALGLWVHFARIPVGAGLRDVLGDALWAMMMAWLLGAAAPERPLRTRSAVALGICVAVEFSQLIHTPALEAARRTMAGSLVLGSGFDPRDLVAYAAGVFVAALLERLVRKSAGSLLNPAS